LGVPGIQVNLQNKDGWSALMITTLYHPEVVPMLLDFPGIQVNLKSNDGWTAQMISVRYQPEVVTKLLDAGADVHCNGILMLNLAIEHNPEFVQIISEATNRGLVMMLDKPYHQLLENENELNKRQEDIVVLKTKLDDLCKNPDTTKEEFVCFTQMIQKHYFEISKLEESIQHLKEVEDQHLQRVSWGVRDCMRFSIQLTETKEGSSSWCGKESVSKMNSLEHQKASFDAIKDAIQQQQDYKKIAGLMEIESLRKGLIQNSFYDLGKLVMDKDSPNPFLLLVLFKHQDCRLIEHVNCDQNQNSIHNLLFQFCKIWTKIEFNPELPHSEFYDELASYIRCWFPKF